MKRKWICFTLALSLVLALAACGGASEEPEPAPSPTAASDAPAPETDAPSSEEPAPSDAPAPAPAAEGFDPALAGKWILVSDTHNGDQEMGLGDFCMLPDGTFFGPRLAGISGIPRYEQYLAAGLEAPKASTGNGKLEILKPLIDSIGELEQVDVQAAADAFSGLEVTYELADITEGSEGRYTSYYEHYDNDQLTLHITGSYQANPTTVYTVDSTVVYEKEYPLFDGVIPGEYLYPYLVGDWTDSLGNQWSFGYNVDTENQSAEFHFEMVDAKGAQHVGEYIYCISSSDDDPEVVETVEFDFEDFKAGAYALVSFDSTTLSLRDATGKDFTLTRA